MTCCCVVYLRKKNIYIKEKRKKKNIEGIEFAQNYQGPTNIRPGRRGQVEKIAGQGVSFLEKARRAIAFDRRDILRKKNYIANHICHLKWQPVDETGGVQFFRFS